MSSDYETQHTTSDDQMAQSNGDEWTELYDMSTFAQSIKELLDLTDEKAQALETLIVEQFSHKTEPGWCCACDADIAFMQGEIKSQQEKL